MGLFRQEAIQAEKQKWLGGVVLSTPLKLTFFTYFVSIIVISVLAFLILFSYTRKQTVTGQLVPDKGVIKIYSPQYGVVIDKKVTEGSRVQKGDVLYIISGERDAQNAAGTQKTISAQIQSRLASLNDDLVKNDRQFVADQKMLESYIVQLKQQLGWLDKQIVNQTKIVGLVQRRQQQYQDIYQKEFISREQYERVKEELLQQQSALTSYERDRINTGKDLLSRQSELEGLLLKSDQQRSAIERNISVTKQELAESEAKREIAIQAPQAGIITALTTQIGQYVDNTRPLVSLIPENSQMLVHLYAPSKSVGFIQEGKEVWLRYQAYPYQKFGQYRGRVLSVSKVALPQNELSSTRNAANEPSIYQIIVKPEWQTISVYGNDKDLQPGMELEADITLDKRKLYEWVLEPLFSMTKKSAG
ncbi:HlyD family secretion protein [Budvicia diplopodorum]|uniref:HlyD family secretion protein n=1 Tax=Budvicia diplopodorum TaxID=1119056 RepID=UPI00135B4CB1|nr:HlyD family efflux transporter periplasmic adaptor subunit [Budvicia diplopodorum]